MRGGEGNPRQIALEVVGVLGAVAGMVQQAIDVVKDVPLVDLLVLVARHANYRLVSSRDGSTA